MGITENECQRSSPAVQRFAVLADRTRLHIVWHLRDGESSVNQLAERVGKAAATVSQHLAKLRLAGTVTSRRDGTSFATSSPTTSLVKSSRTPQHAEHVKLGSSDRHR